MEHILEQITALGKGVEVAIFFGSGYTYTPRLQWLVKIKLFEGDSRIETEAKAEDFESALLLAWGKIEHVARRGMPKALVPQIEHKPETSDLREEEIPF